MDTTELLQALNKLGKGDEEQEHIIADDLLLKYINNPEVTEAFHKIKKWYA